MKRILERTGLFFLSLFAAENAQGQNWVEQIGSDNPFQSFQFGDKVRPASVDVDGDGDLDIVAGACDESWLVFLRNDGSGEYNQVAGVQNPFEGITGCSSPEFVDIDMDGDMDLVIGQYAGDKYAELKLYVNNGSGVFVESVTNPFEGIETDYSAHPAFSDLDNDGDLDLLVGDDYGLNVFENDGSLNFTELDVLSTPFADVENFDRVTPEVVDIDMDGDEDIIFGSKYGDLRIFEKVGAMDFNQIDPLVSPIANVENIIEPFSHFFDYDDDNDMDLIIGDGTGTLRFYLNTELTNSINDLEAINLIAYPNPTADLLQIDGLERIDYVNIFSIDGKLVLNKAFLNNDFRIDVSQLNSGSYIIRAYKDNKARSIRFSKI